MKYIFMSPGTEDLDSGYANLKRSFNENKAKQTYEVQCNAHLI